MTCKECIHKSVCYRVDSVNSDYARKCGDFVSDCKALEQEPCEDAISRQAVLEILNDAYFLKLDDGAALQESVNQLPSVTPAEKVGRWIKHFDNVGNWLECDQCGTDWGGAVNYCPNCGRKMGEQS